MDYKAASDRDLLEQCCQKDDLKAYNELVARYAPKLYATCNLYLNDNFLAEEIALDILFWLWQKRHEINIREKLSAYLHRAARNAVISHFRKQSRNIISLKENYSEDEVMDSRMADYAVLVREDEKKYEQLLSRLGPQHQTVFVLRREHGLSYKEIAQKTNLSVNTIENYIVSALKHFREGIISIMIVLSTTACYSNFL